MEEPARFVHDIRNRLTVVRGFLVLLAERGHDPRAADWLALALDAAAEAEQLVVELENWSGL